MHPHLTQQHRLTLPSAHQPHFTAIPADHSPRSTEHLTASSLDIDLQSNPNHNLKDHIGRTFGRHTADFGPRSTSHSIVAGSDSVEYPLS